MMKEYGDKKKSRTKFILYRLLYRSTAHNTLQLKPVERVMQFIRILEGCTLCIGVSTQLAAINRSLQNKKKKYNKSA